VRSRNKIFIIISVLSLLILRFSFLLRRPLYLDEGIYLSWASLINQSKDFAYLSLQDGKTPLFFWFISYLGPLLGNYLLVGRLISVFAGLITVISWIIIFYKNFDFKKSLLYLYLFLITPFGFLIERMALSDSLLMAFASLSLMFLILSKNVLSDNKNKSNFKFFLYIVFSGISLGFSYATKTTTRLFLVTYLFIALFWVIIFLKNKKIKKIILFSFGILIFMFFYREIISLFRVGGHVLWSSIEEKEKLMIYSPKEILGRITDNPLSIFNYVPLVFEYLKVYISGILIFLLIGIYRLIYLKENRKFLWLIFYWLFITAAICLSGKVMASRYIYVTYPIIIAMAVFGIDYLLLLKNKFYKIFVYLILIIVLGQSCLLVFVPQKAIYSKDDQSYFVSSALTAIGLPEVIDYFKYQDKSKVLVGVCGTWGVPEGSEIILREAGIKSEIINVNKIISKKPMTNNNCEKWWIKKDELCWRLDFGIGDESNTVRYFYVAGDDIAVNQLIDLGVEKIYQFDRKNSQTKNYFLKIPSDLMIK